MPVSERPFVFTKCGLIWDQTDRMVMPKKIGTSASIRDEVVASLRRLRTERIDLYQMHWPPQDGTGLEDYWQTLLDLKAEGKVRAVGLSNHYTAQLEAAERLGHVDTLQPPFSAIHRDVATAELPWCRPHNTGVIVYSPMASGLLTGAFTAERAKSLPKDDWRSGSPDFTGDGLARNLAVANAMRPIATRHGTSVASVAVAWTLAWPAVTAAIVGARSPAQVDGWLDAATLRLSPEDLQEIADAIAATGAGSGPIHPQR
jgi:aryl-alcohol dehydrogenase-like predicted oxidoreductase